MEEEELTPNEVVPNDENVAQALNGNKVAVHLVGHRTVATVT